MDEFRAMQSLLKFAFNAIFDLVFQLNPSYETMSDDVS